MNSRKKYYLNNTSYSNFLENKNRKSFEKYVSFIGKYLVSDGIFLDVGCGTGGALELIKSNNISGLGIDISRSSIKLCQKKKLNCIYFDGTKFPFNREYFDMVGSFNVLEHVDNPMLFLNEHIRVLKEGGYIIIACPNFLSITNSFHWHTSGFIQKFKNLVKIIKKFLCNSCNFEKMGIIARDDFHVDDDACIITNPIDVLNWAKTNNLSVVYWSSQEQEVSGIKWFLDRGIFKYFLGATFVILKKQ
jgi:SAM-dependent methyltransferase